MVGITQPIKRTAARAETGVSQAQILPARPTTLRKCLFSDSKSEARVHKPYHFRISEIHADEIHEKELTTLSYMHDCSPFLKE